MEYKESISSQSLVTVELRRHGSLLTYITFVCTVSNNKQLRPRFGGLPGPILQAVDLTSVQ